MTQTNAQAALQAAATVFSGGRGHTSSVDVENMAEFFLRWLDRQEPDPKQAVRVEKAFVQTPEDRQAKLTRWVLNMRSRNNKHSEWVDVEVIAANQDEALSKALSMYPGHTWANLSDTEEEWEEAPGGTVRRKTDPQ